MANEPNSAPGTTPLPQRVPLDMIHNLPGYPLTKGTDRSYGGLVSSIQANGVKEPVIVRPMGDGKYQLVHGYRRYRASQLAKLKDVPALLYDMTEKEAIEYNRARIYKPDAPIPGKPIPFPEAEGKSKTPPKDKAAPGGKKPAEAPGEKKPTEAKDATTGKKPEQDGKATEAPGENKPTETKDAAAGTNPEQGDKAAETPGEKKPAEAKDAAAGKKPEQGGKTTEAPSEKKAAAPAAAPTAAGPTGTAITQIFDPRLDPPDQKALADLPIPKEGESYFITLHPAYLEKSKFNTFSVNKESDDYKELRKSIELTGVKEPMLTRPKEGGGLEILSGQRRHLVASEFNYPVPVIIQRIDDDDAKILVADSNIHREKVTSFDLSRALRMKMDGMKRKAGRRRKDDPSVPALNSDEVLAKEMGMSVSKLNKVLRLSEATEEVCARYDDGSMELSIAYALSFLKPKSQDMVVSLSDLGYKLSTKRVERMKEPDKKGKLTDKLMREILEDKDITPQHQAPSAPTAGAPAGISVPNGPTAGANAAPLPPSPDVTGAPGETAAPTPGAQGQTAGHGSKAEQEDDITKGKQERPEITKVVLAGDRLRYYFPDVNMTPREIEESVYAALEERRQRQERAKAKEGMKKGGPAR